MAISDLSELPDGVKIALSHLATALLEGWPTPGRCAACQAVAAAETVLQDAQRLRKPEETSKEDE